MDTFYRKVKNYLIIGSIQLWIFVIYLIPQYKFLRLNNLISIHRYNLSISLDYLFNNQ